MKKFYEEIECEHGWTDDKGFTHCELGTSLEYTKELYDDGELKIVSMESGCAEEVCPIFERNNNDRMVKIC